MAAGWSDDLLTGFADIDAQHRLLFETATMIEDAWRSGDLSRTPDALSFVRWYAQEHFVAEEKRMRAAGYPGLADHTAQHEAFRRELAMKMAEYQATRLHGPLLLAFSDWLNAWLVDHVATTDAAMAHYLRDAREVG